MSALLLAGAQSGCGRTESAPAEEGVAGLGLEAGRPVADARHLPPPSGDPRDDAPAVDVPDTDSPSVRNDGAAFAGTANGVRWQVESVEAFSGPDLLAQHEQLTLRFVVGQVGTPGARLTLRIPLTPENVAHVPVRIPVENALAAELSGYVLEAGDTARLWSQDTPPDLTRWKHRAFATAPRGDVTLLALDRAGRTVTGRLDVHLTETRIYDEPDFRPVRMHLTGYFQEVRY